MWHQSFVMYKTFFYLNASSRISEVCQNFHLCFLWFWYNGKTRFIPLFKWYKEMLWRLIDENLQIWSTGVAQPLPRRLKKMLSILKRIFRNFLFFAFRSTENLFFFSLQMVILTAWPWEYDSCDSHATNRKKLASFQDA